MGLPTKAPHDSEICITIWRFSFQFSSVSGIRWATFSMKKSWRLSCVLMSAESLLEWLNASSIMFHMIPAYFPPSSVGNKFPDSPKTHEVSSQLPILVLVCLARSSIGFSLVPWIQFGPMSTQRPLGSLSW